MKRFFAFIFVISFLLLESCNSKEINLGDFDMETFKKDRGACNGKRTAMIADLKKLQPNILGLSERQIFSSIGRYDFQILDRRNQRYFIYFLEKGPHCEQIQKPSQAQTMALKFNAVGLVKEITFQVGLP